MSRFATLEKVGRGKVGQRGNARATPPPLIGVWGCGGANPRLLWQWGNLGGERP